MREGWRRNNRRHGTKDMKTEGNKHLPNRTVETILLTGL